MKRAGSGILPTIVLDRQAKKSLQRQIYDSFREGIIERRLRAGQRIPSTRALAAELGISRFPVLNAYAQLLAEGYFESRVGAGTVISSLLTDPVPSTERNPVRTAATSCGPRRVARRASTVAPPRNSLWLQGFGAFCVGQVAFDQFPLPVWSRIVARLCRRMNGKAAHYGEVTGAKALRESIATYLRTSRSLRCEPEQVVIVSGSQQALELTARVLLDPGSRVWMEEPGYGLARDVFTLAGCHLVPVPVDSEGLNVAAGIRLCRTARAAFVTPSHQYPLGVIMTAARRFRLLEWAQSTGAWIIEDDYDSEYRYGSMPIASLQGLDANARVVYIGTFSKVLFPALRLGYVVIPPDLIDHFRAIRRVADLGPPTFYQEVLAEFITEGHFARHIRRMRGVYAERREMLVEAIRSELGATVDMLGGEAGLHLTITLPAGTHELAIAERAAQQKLWLWPLSRQYIGNGKGAQPGFVLGFGNVELKEIRPAVRKLQSLLA
jgi:GntR family transcriptional regulator / MocR family aminotransferase